MTLYLVRHAIAHERDFEAWPDDSLRPLTESGIEKFRTAAAGIKAVHSIPDRVLSSPYTRAWETASILEEFAGWPQPIECEELGAHRAVSDFLDAATAHIGVPSLAAVGHEPNLSGLISLLATGHPHGLHVEMKKGAVAVLEYGGILAPGSATLLSVTPPRILRECSR